MKYVNVSKKEIKKLFQSSPKDNPKQYYQRVQSIKLSSKGYSISEISKMLDVHYNTVNRWLKKYIKEGMEGIQDKSKSGRPLKIKEIEMAQIEKIIEKEPRRLVSVLPEIEKVLGKKVSIWTIQRALKRNDYTYKRVRKSLKSKRNEEKFQEKKIFKFINDARK